MGKRCLYKSYDTVQANDNDHSERKYWMEVQPIELPEGSCLVMGLNPSFGVKEELAARFINKALEFKPKVLILFSPLQTQRLDKKKLPYNLIWKDDQTLSGKVNLPTLYFWSHPDWTPKHKAIAEQHGHLSRAKSQVEKNEHDVHVSGSPRKHQNFVGNRGYANGQDNTKEPRVCKKEVLAPDKNHCQSLNKPGVDPFESRDDKKRRRVLSDMFLLGTTDAKHFSSQHPSPNLSGPSDHLPKSQKKLVQQVEIEVNQHSEKSFSAACCYTNVMDEKVELQLHEVQDPDSWNRGTVCTLSPSLEFPPLRQQSLASNTVHGEMNTLTTNGDAFHKEELNDRMTNEIVHELPSTDTSGGKYPLASGPQSRFFSLTFAPRPCCPFHKHGSAGWLDE